MRFPRVIVVFLIAALCLFGSDKFAIDGYWKNFFTVVKPIDYDDLVDADPTGSCSYRLNLKLTYSPTDFITTKLSYDIKPELVDGGMSSTEAIFGGISGPSYRTDDLKSPLWPDDFDGSGFVLKQNLDRLYASVALPFADISLGRMPIAWGNARAINPTDVLVPFTFDAMDTEERPGVDAFRMRFPVGMMSEVDFGVLPGEKWDECTMAAFARGKFYIWQTDIALTGMFYRQDAMAGIDLARAIGGASSWIEASITQPAIAKDSLEIDPYLRLTTGADYFFENETYIFGEYHYNGAGAADSKDYIDALNKRAYTQGGVYLLGQHYLIIGGSHQIDPLISASGQIMINANDYSGLISPNIEYNIAQNVYVSAGAFIGTGPAMELSPMGIQILPDGFDVQSEFGNYPDMAFARFRLYF